VSLLDEATWRGQANTDWNLSHRLQSAKAAAG